MNAIDEYAEFQKKAQRITKEMFAVSVSIDQAHISSKFLNRGATDEEKQLVENIILASFEDIDWVRIVKTKVSEVLEIKRSKAKSLIDDVCRKE